MLELRDLRVEYGAAPALWSVSLAIAERKLVCVVGPNGAGKSTLINAIAGLHTAKSGRITMDGIDMTSLPSHRYCNAGIAIVPEGRRLFTRMSVRENLEVGSYTRAARKDRDRSLDYVCTLFPAVRDKLDSVAGSLSGGQQQMVAIGRALMARPRLLLLDEPSLGLSPLIVQAMFRAIREVNAAGTAVLLVEQNVANALEIADFAYLLDEGRIVAEGAPNVLFNNPELRRAYLGIVSGD
ncbi:MAG: ABC transporter ATP-binding protein [Betaproteobacteria bacterium]|nr:ABC transporter ATP-binding protein [Betaproteobacteria bacterium]MDE2002933.1 ABC transporter ATP-binding protein [Betaproteobacteria bacterium]MDE2209334.1 ABC transporter ATP-binding protein [Betaproteobacteria bacterium]MDE2358617.1 ABC transporter ATP-binding protein [Betaproteobacteria bacterium]